MGNDSFSGFHPVINFFYFTAAIGFSMFFMHPVCLSISLFCALTYCIYLKGKNAVHMVLRILLPTLIITALLNPLFNHEGGTIIAYFASGNPLTLESILFGIAAAAMLITVILWFSCFNEIMTSDKIVYLAGRIIPALSLILTMALRFVPRFTAQASVIANAQRGIGRDALSGILLKKAKHGIKIISILITWSLENAIETADSMKCRGYGLPGRTAYSIYHFDRRDRSALVFIAACAAIVMGGSAMGAYHFRFFPTVKGQWSGIWTIIVFAAYFALCVFPLLISIKDEIIWKHFQSKT